MYFCFQVVGRHTPCWGQTRNRASTSGRWTTCSVPLRRPAMTCCTVSPCPISRWETLFSGFWTHLAKINGRTWSWTQVCLSLFTICNKSTAIWCDISTANLSRQWIIHITSTYKEKDFLWTKCIHATTHHVMRCSPAAQWNNIPWDSITEWDWIHPEPYRA